MPQGLIGYREASNWHIVPVSLDGRTGRLEKASLGVCRRSPQGRFLKPLRRVQGSL